MLQAEPGPTHLAVPSRLDGCSALDHPRSPVVMHRLMAARRVKGTAMEKFRGAWTHQQSDRREKAVYLAISLRGLHSRRPAGTSELFWPPKGAFTGASQGQAGQVGAI